MVLSEKTLYSLGRRCVYIFKRRKAKKEIPVEVIPALVTVRAPVGMAAIELQFWLHGAAHFTPATSAGELGAQRIPESAS